MAFIEGVIADLKQSESRGRLTNLDGVTGMSGDKLIGFLQRCALSASQDPDTAYVEVGVYQGLTLTSVSASAPSMSCFGIDDFSQFDSDGKNKHIVDEMLAKHSHNNGHLINADFEEALLGLDRYLDGKNVGLYFVDGPHDYRSQYLSLDFAKPYLADDVVIVVDDSNYEHVRRANHDWLKANPDFALLYDAYTPAHPKNQSDSDLQKSMAGWWNGVNIIVRDKEHVLSRIYPTVSASREKYFTDHFVHPHTYYGLMPQLLKAVTASLPRGIIRFMRTRKKMSDMSGEFSSLNTYSDKLPARRLADLNHVK